MVAAAATAAVSFAALVEEAAEAGVVMGASVAHGDADANLLANRVGFAIRNLLADRAGNLLDDFLTFHAASGDVLLFHHFARNHLADLDRANFFARLPHFHAGSLARNDFLDGAVLAFEVIEEAAVAMAAAAGIIAAAAFVAATFIAGFVAGLNADFLADRAVAFFPLLGHPFAAANLDLLLFPHLFANRLTAFDHFGLVDGLANAFTHFFHDRFSDGLVAGPRPGFGAGLPLVFVANFRLATLRGRATSHDGGSATPATVGHRRAVGADDGTQSRNGRG